MAIVVKFSVSGMSTDKYEAALRQLQTADAGAPPGRLYHVSYGSRDSLQVIDVFDSQKSLEDFGKTLGPILDKLGIKTQPEVAEAYKIIKG